MFLGHFALSLAAKKAAPDTSLGTLVMAGQFLDLLWPVLLLTGHERVRIVPGLTAAMPFDFEHYPISHSLAGAVGWSVLIGVGYLVIRRYRRGAWVVGGLVLSHWFLDVPMHIPDLPVWPGSGLLVGAGAWNSIPLTLALEFTAFALGSWLYVRTTAPRRRAGTWGLVAGLVALALVYLSFFVAPPEDVRSVAIGGLALWLFVAWGAWIDRNRGVAAVPVTGAQERQVMRR